VSMPLAASAFPVECRSMWTCTGNDSPAGLPSPLNHASNAHPPEGLTALIDEHVNAFCPIAISSSTKVSLDYQFVGNPAYNTDRGPVNVFAGRFHWQF
jgi:hypothetical protein